MPKQLWAEIAKDVEPQAQANLFGRNCRADGIHLRTTVRHGNLQTLQAQIGHLTRGVPVEFVGFVGVAGHGAHFFFHKTVDDVAEVALFIIEVEVHRVFPFTMPFLP